MKALWLLAVMVILGSCGDSGTQSGSRNVQALQELKAEGVGDAFLVIRNETDGQHYIQFTVEDEGLVYDRPIQATSKRGLPVVEARYYKPVLSRPHMDTPTVERFLSEDETKRAEAFLTGWGLSADPSYTATHDEAGDPVEYFERFHGLFNVPEERFDEFIVGFFTEVLQIPAANINLQIVTNEAQQAGDGDGE